MVAGDETVEGRARPAHGQVVVEEPQELVEAQGERVELEGLDLSEVIAYGNMHDIGVILYVNRLAMERQLDKALA